MMTFKEFWEKYINEEDMVTVILKGEGDKFYDQTFQYENMLSKYEEYFDTSLLVETATIHPVEEYNIIILSLRENEKTADDENKEEDGINIEVGDITFREFREKYIKPDDHIMVIFQNQNGLLFSGLNKLDFYEMHFDTSRKVEKATVKQVNDHKKYYVELVGANVLGEPWDTPAPPYVYLDYLDSGKGRKSQTIDIPTSQLEEAVKKFNDAMRAASEKIAESIRATTQSIQLANISTPNVTYGPTPSEIHFEPIDNYCIDDIPDTIIGHEEKMKSEIIDKEYKVNEE